MTLSDPNILAVIEIAAYTPILLFVAIVIFRLNFDTGFRVWTSLAILCALRIAGSGLQLATINNPTSTALFEWAAILSSIGLSPLFLATIGVLSRLDKGLDKIYRHPLGIKIWTHHMLLEGLVILSVILLIVGGVKGGSNLGTSHTFDIDGYFKGGVAVIIIVYVGIIDGAISTFIYRKCGPWEDRELFVAMYAALPLLLVRMVYVCLTAYSGLATFNITTGNTWVRLGMTIVMEVLVAIMYLSAGFAMSFRRFKN